MNDCPDCGRLREESASAFSDYVSAKDALAITRKNDKAFAARRREFEKAQGRLGECHKRESQHHAEHDWCGEERLSLEEKFQRLRECLDVGDADAVQQVIFDLSATHNGWNTVPDEVVERLLTLLRNDSMYKSNVAGYVLSYFEFQAPYLTPRQKSLCIGFLNAHGNEFSDVFSIQVVAELREGNYLR